jgi:heme-degrading monooxygenase HmoA
MIARVMTIDGGQHQAAAEDSARAVREKAIPELEKAPGFIAGYWLRDDANGKQMTLVLWEDAQSLDASREASPRRALGRGSVGHARHFDQALRADRTRRDRGRLPS